MWYDYSNDINSKGVVLTKNQKIRERAAACGLCLWQIAVRLGCTDSTFSRKLRQELPPDEQRRVLDIIDELSREGEQCSTR